MHDAETSPSALAVSDPAPLATYREAIETRCDVMVLEVGALLAKARNEHPGEWAEWVDAELPFTIDKARQLIAIHYAFGELPEQLLAQLPRPHQALFALRSLTQGELEAAIERAELGSGTTVAEAKALAADVRSWDRSRVRSTKTRAANIRAAKLLETSAADLDLGMKIALKDWISRDGKSASI